MEKKSLHMFHIVITWCIRVWFVFSFYHFSRLIIRNSLIRAHPAQSKSLLRLIFLLLHKLTRWMTFKSFNWHISTKWIRDLNISIANNNSIECRTKRSGMVIIPWHVVICFDYVWSVVHSCQYPGHPFDVDIGWSM